MSFRWLFALCIAAALPLSAADKESPSWLIDDFEDGDRVAASGLSWLSLSDAVRGGSSVVDLEVAGKKGERALRLKGTLGKDGFGSAWVSFDEQARAVDLRAFTAVRLKVRGEGEWLVGVRGGPDGSWNNFMAPVSGSREWRTVEVPIANMHAKAAPGKEEPKFDAAELRWVGVQTGAGRSGDFLLEIDDVELVGAKAPSSPHGVPVQKRTSLASPRAVDGASWRPLGTERSGDAKSPTLPDVVGLSSWTAGDVVWFRVELAAAIGTTFGVNLVLDVDGDPSNGMAWWGVNKEFHFDRLVTAWIFDSSPTRAEGVVGISSADAVKKGNMMEEGSERLQVVARPGSKEIDLGVPRSALGSGSPRVVVAVGSPMQHNDDLPDTGALTVSFAP